MGNLTGRTRHRRTWWGKMILQVEEEIGLSERRRLRMSTGMAFRWRDAVSSDVVYLGEASAFIASVTGRDPHALPIKPKLYVVKNG
jgi:hypothetical protein